MSNSKYVKYADGEVHEEECEKPDSFRMNLYKYARAHSLSAKAYIRWDSPTRHPVVVFVIGHAPLPELPGKPGRGAHSHKESA